MTKVQKRWHDALAQSGCVATGQSQVQLHHCEGRGKRYEKRHVGQWWVLPIHIALHDVNSMHELNVTHHKRAFHARYGTVAQLLRKAAERVLVMNPGAEIPPEWVFNLADEYYQIHENTESDWLEKFGGEAA